MCVLSANLRRMGMAKRGARHMTNPGVPGGGGRTDFEAIPESMEAQSRALTTAASELAAVPKSLQMLPCGSEDILGEGGAVAAYTNFLTKWTAEMGVQVDALREVARDVHVSAQNYDKLDRSLHPNPRRPNTPGHPPTPGQQPGSSGGNPPGGSPPPPTGPLSPVGRTLQEMTVFPGPGRTK